MPWEPFSAYEAMYQTQRPPFTKHWEPTSDWTGGGVYEMDNISSSVRRDAGRRMWTWVERYSIPGVPPNIPELSPAAYAGEGWFYPITGGAYAGIESLYAGGGVDSLERAVVYERVWLYRFANQHLLPPHPTLRSLRDTLRDGETPSFYVEFETEFCEIVAIGVSTTYDSRSAEATIRIRDITQQFGTLYDLNPETSSFYRWIGGWLPNTAAVGPVIAENQDVPTGGGGFYVDLRNVEPNEYGDFGFLFTTPEIDNHTPHPNTGTGGAPGGWTNHIRYSIDDSSGHTPILWVRWPRWRYWQYRPPTRKVRPPLRQRQRAMGSRTLPPLRQAQQGARVARLRHGRNA